jgi:aspartate/tyrosine/aromatic aminotransferase
VVAVLLADRLLRVAWEGEVEAVRQRIRRLRGRLAAGLCLDRLRRERGLFTRLGLPGDGVARLEREYALYLGPAGFLNVTALPEARVDGFCAAVAGGPAPR